MLSSFLFQAEFLDQLQSDRAGELKAPEQIILNYRTIRTIDQLPNAFRNIKELQLNHNLLETLRGIEQFVCLESFSVKFNYIRDVEEFARITNRSTLVSLNIVGNPCESSPTCTFEYFTRMFPRLQVFNEALMAEKPTHHTRSFSQQETVSKRSRTPIDMQPGRVLTTSRRNSPSVDGFAVSGQIETRRRSTSSFNHGNEAPIPPAPTLMNTANFPGNSLRQYADIDPADARSLVLHADVVDEENLGDTSKLKLDKHIISIEDDIERLAQVFCEKSLKERAFNRLKFLAEQAQGRYVKADNFHDGIRTAQVFYLWRCQIRLTKRRLYLRDYFRAEMRENTQGLPTSGSLINLSTSFDIRHALPRSVRTSPPRPTTRLNSLSGSQYIS
eukprot:TRINITY_DN3222_c0_g1_i1.p1 TRINITY_DN3222_c0_g1~~TRINITY_DN3222_c0_g1_i1.p1  ORF type:complete len:387 (-),score=50.46 TRINITY_DN3222_c0_g1_i1:141-1301(-)